MKFKRLGATWLSWIRQPHRLIYLEYGVVALAILLPLLLPGFVLTMDMVFVPTINAPTELGNTWPLEILLWLLNLILPADIIQKIILFAILLLSGVGMHRLVLSSALTRDMSADVLRWGAYFAGILYMINPFTYSRFMAGQWMVLAGYAIVPFFVLSVLRLAREPGGYSAFIAALWAAAITIVSLHHIGMIGLIFVATLGISVGRYWIAKRTSAAPATAHLHRTITWVVASIGLFILLQSFWLVPTLIGKTDIATATYNFSAADYQAFATNDNGAFGALGNVLRLQGFWMESRDLYALPQNHIPMWGLISLAIWIIVAIGAALAWRTQRAITIFFSFLGLCGIILAVTPLVKWLGQILPIVNGWREPHKFVGLLALAFAYFGAMGIVRIIQWSHKKWSDNGSSITITIALLLPFALTPTILWGFGKQLSPRHYPTDWSTINERLNKAGAGNILALPWHQYMYFDFAGRIIANPMDEYFDRSILVSDNPEYGNIGPTYPNEQKRIIEHALDNPQSLPQILAEQKVRYILIAKERDHRNYSYLGEHPDITIFTETETLIVYENKAYTP